MLLWIRCPLGARQLAITDLALTACIVAFALAADKPQRVVIGVAGVLQLWPRSRARAPNTCFWLWICFRRAHLPTHSSYYILIFLFKVKHFVNVYTVMVAGEVIFNKEVDNAVEKSLKENLQRNSGRT